MSNYSMFRWQVQTGGQLGIRSTKFSSFVFSAIILGVDWGKGFPLLDDGPAQKQRSSWKLARRLPRPLGQCQRDTGICVR
jgi:hypothetical protein